MRLIIQPNYDLVSKWAANFVAKRINEYKNYRRYEKTSLERVWKIYRICI